MREKTNEQKPLARSRQNAAAAASARPAPPPWLPGQPLTLAGLTRDPATRNLVARWPLGRLRTFLAAARRLRGMASPREMLQPELWAEADRPPHPPHRFDPPSSKPPLPPGCPLPPHSNTPHQRAACANFLASTPLPEVVGRRTIAASRGFWPTRPHGGLMREARRNGVSPAFALWCACIHNLRCCATAAGRWTRPAARPPTAMHVGKPDHCPPSTTPRPRKAQKPTAHYATHDQPLCPPLLRGNARLAQRAAKRATSDRRRAPSASLAWPHERRSSGTLAPQDRISAYPGIALVLHRHLRW